jgi:hypothetical protein
MRRLLVTLLWTAAALPAQFRLATSALSVELNSDIGYGLIHLRDINPPARIHCSGSPAAALRLILSRPDGPEIEVTSAQAASVSPQRLENGAILTFHHPDQKLTITCTVKIEAASSRLAWTIAIRNEGRLGLRSLFYPQWAAPLHLPADESRVLYPFLDGQKFIEPGKCLAEGSTKRIQYPGQAALQLLAYHDAESGLLGMTLDGEGWMKHLRVARIRGALDLSFEHNPDERPGTNITLPYETVLQPFRGGWEEAADIYHIGQLGDGVGPQNLGRSTKDD